jgi:hypothetical protein
LDKNIMKKLALATAAFAALAAPVAALAESDVNTAAGPNSTATARLDFSIVIPRVLFLQVGTGSVAPLADNAAVDALVFTVPAASLGNGTDVAGTGGNLTGGAVTVRVFGNNGNITLTAGHAGPMTNGVATDTIPWSEILVTPTAPAAPAAGFIATAIPHPAIPVAAGTGAATTLTAVNKVVRQEGVWTFAYDNTAAYAAGTYGGVNTNNSRMTYTATLP